MKKITLSVIGSCRVYTPVSKAIDESSFNIGHGKTEWFTHSTKDVIQKISIVNNDVVLPHDRVPFIINDEKKYFPSLHQKDFFSSTDVFIIEISSIQSNRLGRFELQQWCVRDLKKQTDEKSQEMLINLVSKIMGGSELVSDLEEIYHLLKCKPIIFVSHNMLTKPDGTMPKPRPIIKKALEDFSSNKSNVLYFDPTPTIFEYGVDVAMKDPAHYTKDFEIVLGRRILAEAEKLV